MYHVDVTCVVAGDWSECSVPAQFSVATGAAEIHQVNMCNVKGPRHNRNNVIRCTEPATAYIACVGAIVLTASY